ncbi:MAG: hypothetical protein IJX75_01970 [Clostridia bacterium]|nr:hypothetical protein [Clostridia bacterium]
MRSEEFISTLFNSAKELGGVEVLQKGVPLGTDVAGGLVLSHKQSGPKMFRHTCVTGVKRSVFIRRMLISLSCLYEKDEAEFFVLSPRLEYSEILRLKNIDATIPYIREKSDLESAKETLKELFQMRTTGAGYPHLIVVLDGLEDLSDCNKNNDLEEYREFLELVSRKEDVEIVSGVDLMKSIFSGYPGTFVGIGNCLVSTREEGKADVTYVNDDASLSQPTPMNFPDSPSVVESVIFLNAVPRG